MHSNKSLNMKMIVFLLLYCSEKSLLLDNTNDGDRAGITSRTWPVRPCKSFKHPIREPDNFPARPAPNSIDETSNKELLINLFTDPTRTHPSLREGRTNSTNQITFLLDRHPTLSMKPAIKNCSSISLLIRQGLIHRFEKAVQTRHGRKNAFHAPFQMPK